MAAAGYDPPPAALVFVGSEGIIAGAEDEGATTKQSAVDPGASIFGPRRTATDNSAAAAPEAPTDCAAAAAATAASDGVGAARLAPPTTGELRSELAGIFQMIGGTATAAEGFERLSEFSRDHPMVIAADSPAFQDYLNRSLSRRDAARVVAMLAPQNTRPLSQLPPPVASIVPPFPPAPKPAAPPAASAASKPLMMPPVAAMAAGNGDARELTYGDGRGATTQERERETKEGRQARDFTGNAAAAAVAYAGVASTSHWGGLTFTCVSNGDGLTGAAAAAGAPEEAAAAAAAVHASEARAATAADTTEATSAVVAAVGAGDLQPAKQDDMDAGVDCAAVRTEGVGMKQEDEDEGVVGFNSLPNLVDITEAAM